VSWVIVVGGVIAVALAVHFVEQRKSRAAALARRGRRELAGELAGEPHRFSLSRDVTETWAVDLRTMIVELTRSDEAGVTTFQLERGLDGSWLMRSSGGADAGARAVPLALAERLEQRFQHLSRLGSPASD
jgi:hypothetical protein